MEILFGPWSRFEQLTGKDILIEPLADAVEVIDELKSHERFSAGWLYPPLTRAPGDSSENVPLIPVYSYSLPVTHRLTVTGGLSSPEAADFIIALVGLLDGIRVTREHWTHFLKAPLELRKLGDLLCDVREISAVLDVACATWLAASKEVRERLFGAIHWLTFSELYEYDFERFFGYYTALDTIYWIYHQPRGGKEPPHATRPQVLACHYGMPVPSWASAFQVDGKGKWRSRLADLRNELVHEARFAGHAIGFAYREDNITLELNCFVRRLVLATIGVRCGYVLSLVTTRQIHGLDLYGSPCAIEPALAADALRAPRPPCLGLLGNASASAVPAAEVQGVIQKGRTERNMLDLSQPFPPWYSELGFDKPTDVRGRSSIADLFCRSKPRTGIYLLGYSDATHYIGQAVDIVRRFGGHRRLSPDIVSFAFFSTRRASLDNAEQDAIHYAEALRVRLRNRVYVADVLGPVDLDELVPGDGQKRWLNDPDIEIIDAAEPVMLPPDSPQRWRTDPQFRQLAARPEYATVQRIVADFIGNCLPVPATTQLSYWSLTALPSTNKHHHPRFCCLNVNMMEVLVCGWLPGSGADLWGFINVAESELAASFGSEDAFAKAFPGVIRQRRLYRAAGGDDCLLEVADLDLLHQLVRDPRIQVAARTLTLRLMRKGPTIYGKYHCPAFADDALVRSNDSV